MTESFDSVIVGTDEKSSLVFKLTNMVIPYNYQKLQIEDNLFELRYKAKNFIKIDEIENNYISGDKYSDTVRITKLSKNSELILSDDLDIGKSSREHPSLIYPLVIFTKDRRVFISNTADNMSKENLEDILKKVSILFNTDRYKKYYSTIKE